MLFLKKISLQLDEFIENGEYVNISECKNHRNLLKKKIQLTELIPLIHSPYKKGLGCVSPLL